MEFDVLNRRGRDLRDPAPLDFRLDGRGNELRLKWREVDLVWRRRM